jgi:hypothetical protein
MSPTIRTRAAIAMLIYVMTNGVLLLAGLVFALVASRFGSDVWIPVVALAILVVTASLAWEISSRLRGRRLARSRYQPTSLRTQWNHTRR